jgi:hypothetical protein
MAYGVKYTATFKDYYNNTILVDILKDGYSSGSTTMTLTGDPLSLEWASERDNIFNPVRGALARLSIIATTANQYSEFFDASTFDYKMRIKVSGNAYWTGYIMLNDYQESLGAAPYVITLYANDLGFLKYYKWDVTDVGTATISSVLYTILDTIDLTSLIKERINIFEDSISSGSSDSVLNQIKINKANFINDQWVPDDLYTVLTKIITIFGAFIYQENGDWNICRIPDMLRSHRYRVFTNATTISSSSSEDLRSALSNYDQMNEASVMMASVVYRKLNIFRYTGYANMINYGTLPDISNPLPFEASDYWTASGSMTFYYYDSIDYGQTYLKVIKMDADTGSSTRYTISHDRQYDIKAGTEFVVKYQGYYIGSSGTRLRIEIKIVASGPTVYYLKLSDGTWSTSITNSDIIVAEGIHVNGDFLTDGTPADGTLIITLFECDESFPISSTTTLYYLSIDPYVINSENNYQLVDMSETINTGALEESDDIEFYIGDPIVDESQDILTSGMIVSSSGAATDAWVPNLGGESKALLEHTRDTYKAQFISPARRIQATLKKDGIKYEEILTLNDKEYLPTSIVKRFRSSELIGEWIEIQLGLEANQVDDFTNGGVGGATPYDTFSESSNTVTLVKTQVITVAYVTVEDINVTDGVRYYFIANITVNSGTVPDFAFRAGGETKTDLVAGENKWEMISDVTSATNDMYFYNQAAETFNGEIEFTVQEMYGL